MQRKTNCPPPMPSLAIAPRGSPPPVETSYRVTMRRAGPHCSPLNSKSSLKASILFSTPHLPRAWKEQDKPSHVLTHGLTHALCCLYEHECIASVYKPCRHRGIRETAQPIYTYCDTLFCLYKHPEDSRSLAPAISWIAVLKLLVHMDRSNSFHAPHVFCDPPPLCNGGQKNCKGDIHEITELLVTLDSVDNSAVVGR